MTNYTPNYTGYPAAYSAYPAAYQQAAQQPQAAYQAAGICWVDGEVGAKAQQLPAGWDITKPFPMWDTNDQVIYLKSFNSMGMPNPLTKLHYTIEEPSRPAPMSTQASLPAAAADMSAYARKEDLLQLREEIKAIIQKEGRSNGKSSV